MTTPFNPGYFNEHELREIGFRAVGDHVKTTKNCIIIGLENTKIGHSVRIDGYCFIIAAVLEKHVIVGAGSVILPKVSIGEGSSVGSLSLVTKSLEPWGVFFCSPAKRLKSRSKKLLELAAQFRQEIAESNSRLAEA